jgi:hypothetical protein
LVGVGHERDDAAATAARADQNVLGEHPAQQVSPSPAVRRARSTRRSYPRSKPVLMSQDSGTARGMGTLA